MSKDCSTQTENRSDGDIFSSRSSTRNERSDGGIFSSGPSTQNVRSDGEIFSSTPRAIATGDIFSKRKNHYIPKDRSIDILFKNPIKKGINFARFDTVAIRVSGDDVPKYFLSFEQAGLSTALIENMKKAQLLIPTPVQKAAIPIILHNRDLLVCAESGTGKTVNSYCFILQNIVCYRL